MHSLNLYVYIFTKMCFSTFTQSIWIDYLENVNREQEKGEAQCQRAGLKATIHFLCGNHMRQLEVACTKRVAAYTLSTIPEIWERNFFTVKAISQISL